MAYLAGLLAGFAAARAWRRIPSYARGGVLTEPVYSTTSNWTPAVQAAFLHARTSQEVADEIIRRWERGRDN